MEEGISGVFLLWGGVVCILLSPALLPVIVKRHPSVSNAFLTEKPYQRSSQDRVRDRFGGEGLFPFSLISMR